MPYRDTQQNPPTAILNGAKIRTSARLGGVGGLNVGIEYLRERKSGANGFVAGWVAGHAGDVYWVLHYPEDEAAELGIDLWTLRKRTRGGAFKLTRAVYRWEELERIL